ncbi:MAG: AMP-binding protein [Flavobacteriales bacterium]|nr:AMP-binding protein [Flavobacteriales bacterium]
MKRVFDLLYNKPADKSIAFGYKRKGKWETLSYIDYANKAEYLASFFLSIGIEKGTKVASICYNRPEWNILDMALLQIGVVHVSLYPNFNSEDFKHSIEYTDAEFVFAESKLVYKQVKKLNLPKVKEIYTFNKITETSSIQELINKGKDNFIESELIKVRNSILPDDVASIYLTSGTSGKSKGVVVTHDSICNTFKALKSVYTISNKDVAFSFAPLTVSSERSLNYYYQANRIATYYTESMPKIIDNMQEVKPTIFLGSPMLLEKVRLGIYEKVKSLSGIQKRIIAWALYLAETDLSQNLIQKKIADILVFKKLRGIMGGKVRFIMAGGSALPINVLNFFWNINIPIYEGYGLSECHIISVNNDQKGIQFGTTGPLFQDVEIVLDKDNQILCRSPYLFKEYYKMPELTKESFDEFGFFKTGDCGEWIDNKYLKINGRIKELFKIQTGKYISPSSIEKKLNSSKYIHQSLVVGFNKPYIVALLVPALNVLKDEFSHELQIDEAGKLEVNEFLFNFYKQIMSSMNEGFIESEKIVKFKLLFNEFTIENGDLTPSMKLKRLHLENKFSELINEMYEG